MTHVARRGRPSLKRRLLLLQLLVFGGLLLASPATFLVISHALENDLDEDLVFLAPTIAKTRLAATAAGRGPCLVDFDSSTHPRPRPRHVLLVDAAGVVACSDGESAPIAPAAVAEARASQRPAFATVRRRRDSLRLVAWPYRDAHGQLLVLELGGSHAAIDQAVRQGTFALLVIDLAALALLLAGSFFVARRTLRPIDAIAQRVQEIDEANLSARLPGEHVDHELGRLVVVLNRMLERLQRAFEAQARFSSDVSHEIRSPLTALRGQIEVALRKERDAAEYQQVLRENLEEVLRLSRLTEDLLSLAKADAGALELAHVPVKLGDLLAQAQERHRAAAAAKGVRVELYVAEAACVIGDPDLLGRLFENLLDNAIRHSPDHGEIQLLLGHDAQRATVAVRDAGEGIPREHLHRVFDRFYRVDTARSRDTGGAGLGLAIAQQIALLHGGEVRASSGGTGAGAVFTVELPLAPG